ncbi:hypothetical protein PA55_05582 [Pseudomonas aeruginosa]|nr:hypothetical protein PA55_05582 [Pseudomonas aeruginosa]
MAQAIAHQQAERNRPEHVAQQPVQAAAVELPGQAAALTDQQQGGDDEGKGDAVVESRLAGYGVAQAVVVAGVVDLDVAGQHRIGGREDRRDQQGQPPVQAEQEMRAQGKAEDTAEQDWSGQQPGSGPGRRAQRQAQLEAADEQRDQQRRLAEVFEPAADVRQAAAPGVQPGRADGQAEQQVDERRADRQQAQVGRSQAERQQDAAQYQQPQAETHAWPGSARGGVTWMGAPWPARGPSPGDASGPADGSWRMPAVPGRSGCPRPG